MGVSLSFPEPPEVPLWRVAAHRGRPLGPGESIPLVEARAERLGGDLDAYRRVCGFAAADPIPPTWPAVAARGLQVAVMTHPSFPLPILGIVHVHQHLSWTRPIGAAEVLSARCRVEGHRVVKAGGEFDLVTEVSAGGEPVWSAVTTILSRAIRGDGERRPRPQAPSFLPTRSTWWALGADQGRRYARVSGDWNPIHLHPWTARPFGFKRPIVHGWWLLARALAELDEEVPAAGRLDARFLSPVVLPGGVAFSAGHVGPDLHFLLQGREPCVVGRLRAGPP